MNKIRLSDQFPIIIRRSRKKRSFTKDVPTEALLNRDDKHSRKELGEERSECKDIQWFTIQKPLSLGQVLEEIEKMGGEPASISQFAASTLFPQIKEGGGRVVALRHSFMFDGEEWFFGFDSSEDEFFLDKVDETAEFQPGCRFILIHLKPIGTVAAA